MRTLRALALAAILGLSACGASQNKPLPMVKADDPVFQLNPDRWQATGNDLMTPPGDGSPHPQPAPVLTSNQVPQL